MPSYPGSTPSGSSRCSSRARSLTLTSRCVSPGCNVKVTFWVGLLYDDVALDGAWELVKNAKEEITKLINISATKVAQDSPSNDLAMMVLNISSNLGKKLPNEVALEFVKKEVGHHF